MNTTHRIPWIDMAKAFSIFAVVLYHTNCLPGMKTTAYLLCLPAFFFAAGMFASPRLTPGEFFRRKTLRLLVPFLVFGLLSWLAWLLIGRNYGSDAEAPAEWWYPLYGMLTGMCEPMIHNRPLWFLVCMMSLEWMYYAVARISNATGRWLLIAGLAVVGCLLSYWGKQWVWELSSAMLVLPVYASGAECREWVIDKASQSLTTRLLLVLAGSMIVFGLGWKFNPEMHISDGVTGNPVLFYTTMYAVVGIWFVLSILLCRLREQWRVLQYIGQNTLLVLCTHIPVFGVIKGIALVCGCPLAFFNTMTGCLVLWAGTFIILMPCAALFNRYCPKLVGKR